MPGLGFALTFGNGGTGGLLRVPRCEELFELRFHFGRGEIALHREDYVGREIIALVERFDVGALDVVERGVFHLPAVGSFGAVDQSGELALRNAVGIVIAARDAAAELGLDEIESVLAEGGAGEDIVESCRALRRSFLESGERDRSVAFADLAFDRGGDVFELLVDLVAGLRRGAAAADQRTGYGRRGRSYRRDRKDCRCGRARGRERAGSSWFSRR